MENAFYIAPTSLTQLPMKNITIIAIIKKIKQPDKPEASGSIKLTAAKRNARIKISIMYPII